MKKFLVSVLAIAGLVACNNEQTIVQQGPAPMEFAGAFVENATRAIDPSIKTETLDAFDVWAYVEEKAGTVLTKERVTRVDDTKWTYYNKQYWTPNHHYYFTAIAPVDTNHWTYNQAEDKLYFSNDVVAGAEDLIYAYEKVTTPATINQGMSAVALQFEHLLSKVNFKFKNGFATENVSIVVKDVQMTAPKAGTYQIAGAGQNDTTTGEWILGEGSVDLVFGDVVELSNGASASAANERLTIPASAQQSYTVSFTVELYNGTVKVQSFDKVSTITGVELEKGKAYNFVAEITPENLDLTSIEFALEEVSGWDKIDIAEANNASDIKNIIENAEEEAYIALTGDINLDELLAAGTFSTRAGSSSASITIPAGKEVVLDLKDFTITGTDNETASFGMFNIAPGAKLTIEGGNGKIQLTATKNRGWNAYSSVISNQRGTFVLNGGTIEHLGGTDMAYGLDNLTNTGAGDAKATINGGVVKSTYRAVRLFLNSTKALDEVIVNGGTIEGTNKSIWVQNANAQVNPGKLVVAESANLYGDVMVSGSNAPDLAIELSVAEAALKNGSTVIPSKIPAGYDVVVKDGRYVVEYGVEENGNEIKVSNAGGLQWIAQQVNSGADYFAGKTIVLTADIDLKGAEWTPIGTETNSFEGNFDGNNKTIKNLMITEHANTYDGYAYAGLFGVTSGSEAAHNYIKNIVIENVTISTTGQIVAAAVAYPYYTDIENVTVKGDISIKGGNYTSGVVSYTRRCVVAKNLSINANTGSVIEGNQTVGGVISDIQMNGGLTANYSNFAASGLTVKGVMHVGGISGIISGQTLDGATVKNVTIVCDDVRKGIVAGSLGKPSTIHNVSYNSVTGADKIVGAPFNNEGAVYKNGDDYSVVDAATDAKSLIASVSNVKDGGVITLTENISFTTEDRTHNSGSWYDGIYYVGDKSFTLDLNGKTINNANGAVNDYLLNFKNDGEKPCTITIKNGTIDAGTAAFCALCTSSTSTHKITINLEDVNLINNVSNGSTIKLRGGAELNVKSGAKITGKDSYLGIECVASTVNIYDGAEIYQNGTSSYNGCLVGVCGGTGVVNVYGGYGKGVKGGFIAMTSGGTINVYGGEWIANTDGTVGNNSNVYVLTAQNNKNESGYAGASIINVYGGTLRGGMDAWVLNDVNVEKAELNIEGGNFNSNPTHYLANGATATESNGIWTVTK